jgi:hypothetical protein
MSIEQITAVRYRCVCDHKEDCGHKWTSDHIPDRCARCKRATWNRPARRHGRNGKQLTAFGRSQTLAEWGREFNISTATISARIKNGWAVENAVKTPLRGKIDKDIQRPELGVLYWSKEGKTALAAPQLLTPEEAMERYPDLDVLIDADGIITGLRKKVEVISGDEDKV